MKQHSIRNDKTKRNVSYRSMRIVYPLTILALIVYCVWQYVVTGELPHIPATILFASAALYLFFGFRLLVFWLPKMITEMKNKAFDLHKEPDQSQ